MIFINWKTDGIRADELEDKWGCRFSDILELIKSNELPFFLNLGRIIERTHLPNGEAPEEFNEIAAEIDQLSRDIPDESPKGDGKTYISCGGSPTMQDGSVFDLFIKHDYLLCALDRRNDRVIVGLKRSDVFFKKSDVKEIEANHIPAKKKEISAFQLSQSDLFKSQVSAIANLAIYCNEQDEVVKEKDKLDFLYKKYDTKKHLAETIVRNLPDDQRRNQGDSDNNIKPRKK